MKNSSKGSLLIIVCAIAFLIAGFLFVSDSIKIQTLDSVLEQTISQTDQSSQINPSKPDAVGTSGRLNINTNVSYSGELITGNTTYVQTIQTNYYSFDYNSNGSNCIYHSDRYLYYYPYGTSDSNKFLLATAVASLGNYTFSYWAVNTSMTGPTYVSENGGYNVGSSGYFFYTAYFTESTTNEGGATTGGIYFETANSAYGILSRTDNTTTTTASQYSLTGDTDSTPSTTFKAKINGDSFDVYSNDTFAFSISPYITNSNYKFSGWTISGAYYYNSSTDPKYYQAAIGTTWAQTCTLTANFELNTTSNDDFVTFTYVYNVSKFTNSTDLNVSAGYSSSTHSLSTLYDLNNQEEATGKSSSVTINSSGTGTCDATFTTSNPLYHYYICYNNAAPSETNNKDSFYTSWQCGFTWSANIYIYQRYTITYDANGGSGTMAETPFAHGKNATVANNTFTNTNATFTGWNTSPNGTGTAYSAGSAYATNANLTLYAQWQTASSGDCVVTVSSNNSNYGTVTGSGSYTAGTFVTLTATPAEGYKFVQWNDGNTEATRTVMITANSNYTATFAPINQESSNSTNWTAIIIVSAGIVLLTIILICVFRRQK